MYCQLFRYWATAPPRGDDFPMRWGFGIAGNCKLSGFISPTWITGAGHEIKGSINKNIYSYILYKCFLLKTNAHLSSLFADLSSPNLSNICVYKK